jgi:hypothetical protein
MMDRCLVHLLVRWLFHCVADSSCSTICWVPALGRLVLGSFLVPEPLPPEPGSHTPKAAQAGVTSWFWRNVPTKAHQAITKLNTRSFVSQLGPRRSQRSPGANYRDFSPGRERRLGRSTNRWLAKSLRLITITCLAGTLFGQTAGFDSDAKELAINNCSTRCLTNSARDFVLGTVRRCNIAVLGVGGTERCTTKGTARWPVEDDQGRKHDFLMPNTPLCPGLPTRLFSL